MIPGLRSLLLKRQWSCLSDSYTVELSLDQGVEEFIDCHLRLPVVICFFFLAHGAGFSDGAIADDNLAGCIFSLSVCLYPSADFKKMLLKRKHRQGSLSSHRTYGDFFLEEFDIFIDLIQP